MKYFLLLMFLISSPAYACQNTANKHELLSAMEDRSSMREFSSNFAEKSEYIFIGSIRKYSENSAIFEDIVNLKGRAEEGIELHWEEPDEIIVGCSGTTDFLNLNVPKEQDNSDYLIYASGEKLLRINFVGSFASKPSGYEEIEWLLNQRIKGVRIKGVKAQ